MNLYQFESITKKILKSQKISNLNSMEMDYVIYVYEKNILKVHYANPEINSGRVPEAILLTLHKINGYLTGKDPGTEAFENDDNKKLMEALLNAMDPFTNKDIEKRYKDINFDYSTYSNIHIIFTYHIANLIKLYKSVNTRNKMGGYNGYFDFLEDFLKKVDLSDETPNYAIAVPRDKNDAEQNYSEAYPGSHEFMISTNLKENENHYGEGEDDSIIFLSNSDK